MKRERMVDLLSKKKFRPVEILLDGGERFDVRNVSRVCFLPRRNGRT